MEVIMKNLKRFLPIFFILSLAVSSNIFSAAPELASICSQDCSSDLTAVKVKFPNPERKRCFANGFLQIFLRMRDLNYWLLNNEGFFNEESIAKTYIYIIKKLIDLKRSEDGHGEIEINISQDEILNRLVLDLLEKFYEYEGLHGDYVQYLLQQGVEITQEIQQGAKEMARQFGASECFFRQLMERFINDFKGPETAKNELENLCFFKIGVIEQPLGKDRKSESEKIFPFCYLCKTPFIYNGEGYLNEEDLSKATPKTFSDSLAGQFCQKIIVKKNSTIPTSNGPISNIVEVEIFQKITSCPLYCSFHLANLETPYPFEFDLKPYLSENAQGKMSSQYELNGIYAERRRNDSNIGHIVAYVKDGDEEWYLCNDDAVEKVDPELIYTLLATGQEHPQAFTKANRPWVPNEKDIYSSNGVKMLFYKRKNA